MTIVVTMKNGDGKYILSNSEVGGGVQTLTAKLIGSKTFLFFFKKRYSVYLMWYWVFLLLFYTFSNIFFSAEMQLNCT